jgi:mannose/fructose-specific phosphotransferase system component IIA
MTKKIFLISHNDFASGLKKSLEMICGQQEHLYSFGLMPGGHPDIIISQIETMFDEKDQVIILGDIAGGSMCNAALRLTKNENVTLIAGMNLPLAMEMVLSNPNSVEEVECIIQSSREGLKQLVIEKFINLENEFF